MDLTHLQQVSLSPRSLAAVVIALKEVLSNEACFIIRGVKPFVSQDALNMIYYAYFNSVMTFGLLFWGNSSQSIKVFNYKSK
jgi:hypothetical protein